MKTLTYNVQDFRRGIDPNIYKDGGVARIEHFDTVNGQMRQWGAVTASTSVAYGSDLTLNKLNSFAVSGTTIYALGYDSSAGDPAIFQWRAAPNNDWSGLATFAAGASAWGLFLYKGDLYGLYNGTNIFKCTLGGTVTVNHAALTYATFAQPFVHSKDNIAYFFTNNVVTSFDGTTPTTALTLPTNFRITSACEDGDYVLIVGYDTDGKATGYLWDRDSSLATTTAKYDLGRDTPYYVSRIGGTTFFISKRADSVNSLVTDQSVLVVRYRNGDRADILAEWQMPTLGMALNSSFTTSHTIYFAAYAKLRNDASAKQVVFGLSHEGKLFIALNMSENAGTSPSLNAPVAIFREGDGWWVSDSGGTGAWHLANAYTTDSTFETNILRSEDLRKNVNFKGAIVTCDPLPTNGRIIIKGRKNEETAWTTLATFTTVNSMKFALSELVAKNALNGLDRSKQFQLQVVADLSDAGTIPVVITGFQATYEELADENHG